MVHLTGSDNLKTGEKECPKSQMIGFPMFCIQMVTVFSWCLVSWHSSFLYFFQHQNPQQLSANLWAAVRTRGCQFLGPAMQEEVLKLVLLALEDGSALSRKVLVMFVVQRLEPHFPQASKTSIGHVVQLLYRASCFIVSQNNRYSVGIRVQLNGLQCDCLLFGSPLK